MSIFLLVAGASSKPFWMVTPQKIVPQLYPELSLLSLHLCQTIKALNRLRCWSTSIERRVWHHTTMVAKCLDLNSLCWWRRPFAFSNDARKVWATVLFLSAIIHRKVINVNFFRFFFFLPPYLPELSLLRSRNFDTMAFLYWRGDRCEQHISLWILKNQLLFVYSGASRRRNVLSVKLHTVQNSKEPSALFVR